MKNLRFLRFFTSFLLLVASAFAAIDINDPSRPMLAPSTSQDSFFAILLSLLGLG